MQKAIRRVERARKHAGRKAEKSEAAAHFKQLFDARVHDMNRNSELAVARKRERQRRREHWAMGPLSPWRQNMENMINAGFGSLGRQVSSSWSYANPVDRAEELQQRRLKESRPLAEDGRLLAIGDRVCVVRGHAHVRGQIGVIEHYSEDQHSYTLAGIGEFVTSQGALGSAYRAEGEENKTERIPQQFKQAELRLVYPLPDPDDPTAPPRDTILENVVARNFRFHPFDNETQFDRVVMPQGIRIPWPEREKQDYPTHDVDTPRIHSEAISFLPRLLSPPMPASVIDELRNRHSDMRMRFSDAFAARKTAEDEAAAHETERSRALLPQGARNIARLGRGAKADGAERRPPPELSDELAAAIGAYIEGKTAAQGRPAVDG